MDMKLDGKRALVLGASKGLGFAIASALAQEKARVAITSRSLETALAAAAKMGTSVVGFACDTASSAAVDRLHADVQLAFGGIDILVLNSGGPPPGLAQGVPSEQWRAAFDQMFVNLVRLADLAIPGMVSSGFGRIISVVSSGVIEPIPNLAISNAIRPALIGWSKTLAGEVAKHGVTVNAIAPGRIATDRLEYIEASSAQRTGRDISEIRRAALERIPAGRYGVPEEYAASAVFLASEAASFMTGGVLRVDGGQISSV